MVLRLPRSLRTQTVINISDHNFGWLGQSSIAYILVSVASPVAIIVAFIVVVLACPIGISGCVFNDFFMFNIPRT